ncbi:similar to Saccharomyces cerevisiae YKR046C PET10 Protein of unknown function that co-purifies with lipid particles [Maudiozyma barnettii]|uniref:Uncharacterized protein n=1 Tax=Maudiozyma barnettii TaxID=61262 RepID=A0A8H2ZI50_9SACH|nr:Pln1p [Kazachstania barnettii]CAB4254598.1 similar to Saccharomyces cerevisiae YKR046C PET10 Protein of unknown function that co-purifies with lipid particles [Kazachstania barnettii]CAD1782640.1 similar to Saccharomyces cerevisiae YKR046C PET10 Protein of unknown function that co-purifies with lipid particles [Kazachstania barnettii]
MTARRNHSKSNKPKPHHHQQQQQHEYTSMPTDIQKKDTTTSTDAQTSTVIQPLHYESATYDHLKKYDALYVYADKYVPQVILTWLALLVTSTQSAVNRVISTGFESNYVPHSFKTLFNKLLSKAMALDGLLNYLVLDEGVGSFKKSWDKQGGVPGVWCLYFTLDYIANCFNVLLQRLVVVPLNLGSVSDSSNSSNNNTSGVSETSATNSSDTVESGNLPHLDELSSTTKSLTQDLHAKVQNDYIQPTKEKANKLILEPTQNAYKSVSETYGTHLNKQNNNVPKALYSTGREIGNTTLKRFNVLVQSPSKEEVDQLKTN